MTGVAILPSAMRAGKVTMSRAYSFAFSKFVGKYHRDGKPAFLHSHRVAMRLIGNPTLVAIAYLHDLLEDTPTTADELRKMFGDRITDAVIALTREKGESWSHYMRKIYVNRDAILVKIADIEDNLARMDEKMASGSRNGDMYREELEYLHTLI